MPGYYDIDFSRVAPVGNVITPLPGNDEYVGPSGGAPVKFGPMRIGHSLPDMGLDPPPISSLGPWDGLTLEVNQDSSPTAPATCTRTLNVVDPAHPHPQSKTVVPSLFSLPNFETLRAEVVFDLSEGIAPTMPPNQNAPTPLDLAYAWGVRIALKSGTADDQSTDMRFGPSCQFFGGGCIHFNFTDFEKEPGNTDPMFDQKLVSTASYADYAGSKFRLATEFSLSLLVSRWKGPTGAVSLTGQATLRFGGQQFSGNLTGLPPDLTNIDAVGVALASKNKMERVNVRLKRFQMQVMPRKVPLQGVTAVVSKAPGIPIGALTTVP